MTTNIFTIVKMSLGILKIHIFPKYITTTIKSRLSQTFWKISNLFEITTEFCNMNWFKTGTNSPYK